MESEAPMVRSRTVAKKRKMLGEQPGRRVVMRVLLCFAGNRFPAKHRRTRMTTRRPGCSPSIFRFFATVLLLTMGASLSIFQARAEQLAATYGHGSLSVTIPYHSSQE